MGIIGLNHAVLWVSDPAASAAFYGEALGFRTIKNMDGKAVFLRAPDSTNDHDLGLFAAASRTAAPTPPEGGPGIGMYHLAWEVPTLGELVEHRTRLVAMDALVGQSDHGVTKSLYAKDPDGLEFEIMWEVPSDRLDGVEPGTSPLDLVAELARFGPDLLGGTN